MRKVKNITVCVKPEIYRNARHLAAEYDTTVSTIVAWLLERLPAALERSRFPKGGPKPAAQPSPTPNVLVTPPTPLPPGCSQEQAPACVSLTTGSEAAKTDCETVPATLTQ